MTTFTSRSADLPAGTTFPWIADGLAYGGDYSPEQWPESVWQEDVALMRRAGVNSLNVGVFSWGLLEIADGEFDFAWLDRVLDLLAENRIGVNLATPTAAPPIWLLQAHPEIAPVSEEGVRVAQGGRLGWHPSSQVFRRYALRMVETLATRYAEHPALKMWHVSNELGNENHHSYDAETASAWRSWLLRRHGGVAEVNAAWGSAFWGHHYTSISQVEPPRWSSTNRNPGLLLDWERFSSDALLAHYRAERDVLRRITPTVPITTNFMVQNHPGVANYATWAREVDLVANDHYTIGADPERYGELAFSADRVRGISSGEPWLLIEHSTSAVNWQKRNRAKSFGELARNSLAHIARGADGALFFQWRQSTAGSESFHSAVVPHAGAETKVFREAADFGALLQRISEVRGSLVERARVAILFDEDSAAALRSSRTPSVDLTALDVPLALHRELTRRGVAVDVIPPSSPLGDYELILVPTLFLLADEHASRLQAAAHAGAHVLVTAFSGIVTPENRVREGGYPGALRDLLGVRFEEVFPLQPDETVTLDNGWTGTIWSELGAAPAADVLARYVGGELDGRPAMTRRTIGSGTAAYLSTHLTPASLTELVGDMLDLAHITPVTPGQEGVERVRRRTEERSWLFAINHSAEPLTVTGRGVDLVTGARVDGVLELAGGAVAVIRED
ncbi:beta-galactosidase [Rathayibacter sp. ZW T2_19]|uniref:Beta-galactosidase n=1 Tax=Rathayibacter rubneri TaxID=2950106 RepID=A0A9X2DXV9_9MICO|nr:beta-galactosidase [Rathayibacter rubneri]MCM6761209.1 beta-galactosidase [Rathayibacter rubneri]